MKNLIEKAGVQELNESEMTVVNGGALSVNEERAIAFLLFGAFGLAIYEISRNQSK